VQETGRDQHWQPEVDEDEHWMWVTFRVRARFGRIEEKTHPSLRGRERPEAAACTIIKKSWPKACCWSRVVSKINRKKKDLKMKTLIDRIGLITAIISLTLAQVKAASTNNFISSTKSWILAPSTNDWVVDRYAPHSFGVTNVQGRLACRSASIRRKAWPTGRVPIRSRTSTPRDSESSQDSAAMIGAPPPRCLYPQT